MGAGRRAALQVPPGAAAAVRLQCALYVVNCSTSSPVCWGAHNQIILSEAPGRSDGVKSFEVISKMEGRLHFQQQRQRRDTVSSPLRQAHFTGPSPRLCDLQKNKKSL
jgi:hypothetical protein